MKTFTKDSLIIASRQELIDIILGQVAQIDKLTNTITEHAMQLEWMKRQLFGAKSERFVEPDDLQTALDLGIIAGNVGHTTETTTITYNRKKSAETKEPVKGHGRGAMPTHLPIKKTVVEPQEDTTGMTKIGEEESWYYEMDKPASLHIVLISRPKYALPDKSGVIIGTLPALPVEKGNAGPGLLANIVTEKYLYHMPLDRQRKKFEHEYNVKFSPSWLSDNVGSTVFWLEPVYDKYQELLLKSTYLQGDETPIQVLIRDGRGKTHKGYLWVYHDPIQHIVLFDYRESRSHKGPSDFLKNFHGTLQIDGYEGYSDIIAKNGLVHAGCMDHVRRRFDKALPFDKERAAYALETMKAWYMVEREAKERNLSFDERLELRKKKVTGQWPHSKLGCNNSLPRYSRSRPLVSHFSMRLISGSFSIRI